MFILIKRNFINAVINQDFAKPGGYLCGAEFVLELGYSLVFFYHSLTLVL